MTPNKRESHMNITPWESDNSCPHCHSVTIEWYGVAITDNGAEQEMTCLACWARWTNVYHYAGYTARP